MNEERHHLISLGTDKVVHIWDKNYIRIQTIFDKVQYKLSSIVFDHWTNNILLGSRKVNCWNFHTQEEIKTSHEHPVVFALSNIEKFESVISADDGGFISVWDVETGQLLFKFGDTHGVNDDEDEDKSKQKGQDDKDGGEKRKITAGCFDQFQRRLITAGKDGKVKMWNFSNGSKLKDLIPAQVQPDEDSNDNQLGRPGAKNNKSGSSKQAKKKKNEAADSENSKKVDQEVTTLCCISLEQEGGAGDESTPDEAYCIAVGWDKKLYQWDLNDEDEEIESKPQPDNSGIAAQQGHKDDIMSAVYCESNKLIYTGGHDGTLLAWSLETRTIKKTLHDQGDKTCTGDDYVRQSKSVDQLVIMKKREKLLSMTADQYLRFWSTEENKDIPNPCFRFWCNHPDDDNLTSVAVSEDNDVIVTGDTQGQMKMWDISEVDLEDQSTDKMFLERYFIAAHRSQINQISIVEVSEGVIADRLIISASNDCNINLFRLKDGVKIG